MVVPSVDLKSIVSMPGHVTGFPFAIAFVNVEIGGESRVA